jgi:hypothetical protein
MHKVGEISRPFLLCQLSLSLFLSPTPDDLCHTIKEEYYSRSQLLTISLILTHAHCFNLPVKISTKFYFPCLSCFVVSSSGSHLLHIATLENYIPSQAFNVGCSLCFAIFSVTDITGIRESFRARSGCIISPCDGSIFCNSCILKRLSNIIDQQLVS